MISELLLCVMSVLLFDSVFCTIFSTLKKRLETTHTVLQKYAEIAVPKHMRNHVFRRMRKNSLILRIKMSQLKFVKALNEGLRFCHGRNIQG